MYSAQYYGAQTFAGTVPKGNSSIANKDQHVSQSDKQDMKEYFGHVIEKTCIKKSSRY